MILAISCIDIDCDGDAMAREQLKILTEPMYYILLTLTAPRHGYGIMQEIDRLTEGRVQVGAGTLYNLLSRFEEEGFIIKISEENRRKTYVITDKGLSLLEGEYKRLRQLVADGKEFIERDGVVL